MSENKMNTSSRPGAGARRARRPGRPPGSARTAESFRERKRNQLPSVRVTRADLSTVYRISDGALSPMEGPMRANVWNRVLDEQCVEVGGRRLCVGDSAVTAGDAGRDFLVVLRRVSRTSRRVGHGGRDRR